MIHNVLLRGVIAQIIETEQRKSAQAPTEPVVLRGVAPTELLMALPHNLAANVRAVGERHLGSQIELDGFTIVACRLYNCCLCCMA